MTPRRIRPRRRSGQAERPVRGPDTVPLADYARFVRRHLVLLGLVPLLLGATGVLVAVLIPQTYVSFVSVLAPGVPLHAGELAGPNDGTEENRPPKDATVDTEAQLVESDEVLARLQVMPGFRESRARLRERISLTVPANTRVLTIGVAARTPAQAQDGAEAVGEAYLNLRHEILGGIQQRNRESLSRREALLQQELKALPADTETLSRLTTRTRRQAVLKQIGEVRKQLSAIDGQEVQSGEIMRNPSLPRRPEDRRRDVALASGTGIGLLAALGAALLRDRRPRRIRSAAVLAHRTDVPVFGMTVPEEADRDGTCRRLRNLVFDEGVRAVLLTGAPAGAAMPVARELSRLCASSGAETTLLWLQEDDGRAGAQPPAVLDVSPRLSDGRDPDAASCTQRWALVTDGDRGLHGAIARARERSEIVVVTGPALGSVGAVSLAGFCDLTVVVAERTTTLDLDVARGIAELAEAAAPVRGLILAEPADAPRDRKVTTSPTSG